MAFPTFASGDVLNASDMNAVGLWLVKTQTIGTTVASVTVTGAFSSSYDSYRILVSNVVSSTATDMKLTFGSATTGYYGSYRYDNYQGTVAGFTRFNNAANTQIGGVWAFAGQACSFDVFNPFATARTNWVGQWYGNTYSGWYAGNLDTATSYTSFTIAPVAGTLTGGTIRVYGYRN